MAKISDLTEELLVKIVYFLPTRDAVATSVLSKQWKFVWMWCPDLDFDCVEDSVRDFINRNLPLYKAPFINSLCLNFDKYSIQPETFKSWVETAVSLSVRNLTIRSEAFKSWVKKDSVALFIPSSLYTCNSLVTLELKGRLISVDVPGKACLSSLKNLHLSDVTYSDKDSLRLLLCCCPVLEDLLINRHYCGHPETLVIMIPSLRRLSLFILRGCSDDDGCVIVTPSLKYFKLHDERRYNCSYSIEHMPELEEADISLPMGSYWEDLLKSISTVKHISLVVLLRSENETLYGDGIVFSKLESLKLRIYSFNWTKITYQLLKDSPNLQVLDLMLIFNAFRNGEPVCWISNQSLVPECLLSSLETFKFVGPPHKWMKEEEKDFLCFIIKHALCLVSTSIQT